MEEDKSCRCCDFEKMLWLYTRCSTKVVVIIFCFSEDEKEGLIFGSYISSGYLHILTNIINYLSFARKALLARGHLRHIT